jgi:hypothetical protein
LEEELGCFSELMGCLSSRKEYSLLAEKGLLIEFF